MGITSELAAFSANISLPALPPPVVERARFLVLDLVGNIVRARHDAESTAPMLAAVRALGMAAGNSGVFGDCAPIYPSRRGTAERRAGSFARFRRYARGGLAAPWLPRHFGRIRRRRDDRGRRRRRPGRHRRRLRGRLPHRPCIAGGRPLRPRLPSHRDLRRVRRRRGGRARVRARHGRRRLGVRHRAQPIGRQPAVPGEWRLDQAVPGRLVRHGRARGRDPGPARGSKEPPTRWRASTAS